jgi:dihydroorotate dehydrogenase (fumarate)
MTVDLSCSYLGLTLSNPFVAAANPLTERPDKLRQLEEAGIAAAVLPSLFEEQVEHDENQVARVLELGSHSYAEALDYLPELTTYNTGPDQYLRTIETAKGTVRIPIIASLNGATRGGWLRYARLCEEAGADALELNLHSVPTDVNVAATDVESRYLEIVSAVRQAVNVPVSVKLGPHFSAPVNFAARLVGAGSNALVLFNRSLPPSIDLDELEVISAPGLSTASEVRLRIQWIGILAGQIDADLAATGGVHDPDDAIRLLLAGADIVQLATILLRKGPDAVRLMIAALRDWLEANEYRSLNQAQGSMSWKNCPNPEGYERTNYMRSLISLAAEHLP